MIPAFTILKVSCRSGVADWGPSYAFVSVPYEKDGQSRHIMVGWTYEVSCEIHIHAYDQRILNECCVCGKDEDEIVLAKQQGYQVSPCLRYGRKAKTDVNRTLSLGRSYSLPRSLHQVHP